MHIHIGTWGKVGAFGIPASTVQWMHRVTQPQSIEPNPYNTQP